MGRKPKSATNAKGQRRGCNCKRSGCLKNYCECYESKTPCTINCKCLGCRNTEDRKDDINVVFDQKNQTKIPADMKPYMPNNMRNKCSTSSSKQVVSKNARHVEKLEHPDVPVTVEGLSTAPAAAYIDTDVTAHAVTCMIEAAATSEILGLTPEKTEFFVISQLGQTLIELNNHVRTQQSREYMLYDKTQSM